MVRHEAPILYDFDPRLVVPNESLSLLGGAIAPWARGDRKLVREAVMTLARTYGIDPEAPFAKLPKKHRDLVLYARIHDAVHVAIERLLRAAHPELDRAEIGEYLEAYQERRAPELAAAS